MYSPVERAPDGAQRWRTWYADAAGEVQKILEPEMDAEGRYRKELYRGPSGELRTYQEYVYDRYDELLEVVTHAPDGRILNRQHSHGLHDNSDDFSVLLRKDVKPSLWPRLHELRIV